MNYSLRAYRKALKSQLCCCADTRRKLLTQFDQMSAFFLAENPSPSQAELTAAFGSPRELAGQLMEEVSEQELRQYRRSRWLFRIAAGAIALLLVGYAAWITYSVTSPIEVVETIIIYEEDL
ncbi:MAG: hypothetical protein ACI3U8_06120 [Candidatus Onthomonas sp.]